MNILRYEGREIRRDGEFFCLTDMWKAAGAPVDRRPIDWSRRPGGAEFIAYIADNLAESLNVAKSHDEVFRVVRGGNDPATWGHWQIALAYAKYLSPRFHAWCNTVVRDHVAGLARPSSPPVVAHTVDATIIATAVAQAMAQSIPLIIEGFEKVLDRRRESDTGVIGPRPARRLCARLRQIAALRAGASAGKRHRQERSRLEMALRERVHHYGANSAWACLPRAKEPDVTRFLDDAEADAARAAFDRRQLTLVQT